SHGQITNVASNLWRPQKFARSKWLNRGSEPLRALARCVTGASLRQISRRKRDVVIGTLVLNTSGRCGAGDKFESKASIEANDPVRNIYCDSLCKRNHSQF